MIYAISIDKNGVFFSRIRNTYEEALACAKDNISKYHELSIYEYWPDGEMKWIQTKRAL